MFKNIGLFIFGILFFILLMSLFFYQYKIVEGYSSLNKTDYQLEQKCGSLNPDNINLPSYGFYFNKDRFKSLYYSPNNNTLTTQIVNSIINSTDIFNIDKCNDVLYSIGSNNKLKSYNLDNNNLKMTIITQNSNLVQCIMQYLKDSKINYVINGKENTLSFSSNQSYKITFSSLDLNFKISNMDKYNVKTITRDNTIIYNSNSTTNEKYFYGKITYDNDPNNYIHCLCINY